MQPKLDVSWIGLERTLQDYLAADSTGRPFDIVSVCGGVGWGGRPLDTVSGVCVWCGGGALDNVSGGKCGGGGSTGRQPFVCVGQHRQAGPLGGGSTGRPFGMGGGCVWWAAAAGLLIDWHCEWRGGGRDAPKP